MTSTRPITQANHTLVHHMARGHYGKVNDDLQLNGFMALFERSGLSLRKTHLLPTGFIAFELAPTDRSDS
jgi:hypothetical protein